MAFTSKRIINTIIKTQKYKTCLNFYFERDGRKNMKLVCKEVGRIREELGEEEDMIKIYCILKR